MTTLDMTNLDNVNRAKVSNSRAFLEMDMSNLDRQQQVATIKAQAPDATEQDIKDTLEANNIRYTGE